MPDQLIDQAIKRAAEEQLALKGLTKVENNADLYIGYQVVINLEKSISLWGTSDGPGGDGAADGAPDQYKARRLPSPSEYC